MIDYSEMIGRIAHREGMAYEILGYDARKVDRDYVYLVCRNVEDNRVVFIPDVRIEKIEPKPLVSVYSRDG